jgi:hypothetical protein
MNKYTAGETLNHIGSHPIRTWQTHIYNSKKELVFIAVGETKEESISNASKILTHPEILNVLSVAGEYIDNLVLRVPTGNARNKVCDFNIKLKTLFDEATK